MSDDSISRQAAIDALAKFVPYAICDESTESYTNGLTDAYNLICQLPSAQSEVRPIDYQDCSNAMLKMWMDNVVTDGEYNRIMDKLNAHWGEEGWMTL